MVCVVVCYHVVFIIMLLLSCGTIREVRGIDYVFVYDPLFKDRISPVRDLLRARRTAVAKYGNASSLKWKFLEMKANDTLQTICEIADLRHPDDRDVVVFLFTQQTHLLASLFQEDSLVLKYGVSVSNMVKNMDIYEFFFILFYIFGNNYVHGHG